MQKLTTSNAIIGVLYVALLGSLVSLLLIARQRVLVSDSSELSRQDWENWRDEARRQEEGDGPVSRRVPKSNEPPSLVLLRDHFTTSLAILLVLSSALYFTLAIMFRGILVGPSFQLELADDLSSVKK